MQNYKKFIISLIITIVVIVIAKVCLWITENYDEIKNESVATEQVKADITDYPQNRVITATLWKSLVGKYVNEEDKNSYIEIMADGKIDYNLYNCMVYDKLYTKVMVYSYYSEIGDKKEIKLNIVAISGSVLLYNNNLSLQLDNRYEENTFYMSENVCGYSNKFIKQ